MPLPRSCKAALAMLDASPMAQAKAMRSERIRLEVDFECGMTLSLDGTGSGQPGGSVQCAFAPF